MANTKLIKTAVSMTAALLACIMLGGCKHKDDHEALTTNVPIITADPEGGVTAGPTATPEPAYTDVPIVTADPEGGVTAGPTATPEPAYTDVPIITAGPTATPANATDAPVYTDVPIVTAAPGVTAGPTATPKATAAPVYTDVPVITAGPTATPKPSHTDTPVATQTPGAPATPTPKPTDTPKPTATPVPDPATELTRLEPGKPVYFDLDYDGKPETVTAAFDENAKAVKISVTVGKNGKTLEETYSADRFIDAFVNNFNTGDHLAEIVVSSQTGERDRKVTCFRLDPGSNGLVSCSAEGAVSEVNGNALTICRYLDIMGTWDCSAEFVFSNSSFMLEQTSSKWTVIRESGRWCTLSESIFIGIDSAGPNNEVMWLDPGVRMYPVSTDLDSRIDVVLESSAAGFIPITVDPSGSLLYGGKSISNCFSDLTFIH